VPLILGISVDGRLPVSQNANSALSTTPVYKKSIKTGDMCP